MKTWIIVAAFALLAASATAATPPWQVFATGVDASKYAAIANVSADAPKSEALAVRVTSTAGKTVNVDLWLSCTASMKMQSRAVVVATTPLFKKCSVSATALTNHSGRVRVELLRR